MFSMTYATMDDKPHFCNEWENEMRSLGYKDVMLTAEAGDDAHHFYCKLGYKDMGSIVMSGILHYEQNSSELFMGKAL